MRQSYGIRTQVLYSQQSPARSEMESFSATGKMEAPVAGKVKSLDVHSRVTGVCLCQKGRIWVGSLKSPRWETKGTGDHCPKAMAKTEAPPKKKEEDCLLSLFIPCRLQAYWLVPPQAPPPSQSVSHPQTHSELHQVLGGFYSRQADPSQITITAYL